MPDESALVKKYQPIPVDTPCATKCSPGLSAKLDGTGVLVVVSEAVVVEVVLRAGGELTVEVPLVHAPIRSATDKQHARATPSLLTPSVTQPSCARLVSDRNATLVTPGRRTAGLSRLAHAEAPRRLDTHEPGEFVRVEIRAAQPQRQAEIRHTSTLPGLQRSRTPLKRPECALS